MERVFGLIPIQANLAKLIRQGGGGHITEMKNSYYGFLLRFVTVYYRYYGVLIRILRSFFPKVLLTLGQAPSQKKKHPGPRALMTG